MGSGETLPGAVIGGVGERGALPGGLAGREEQASLEQLQLQPRNLPLVLWLRDYQGRGGSAVAFCGTELDQANSPF